MDKKEYVRLEQAYAEMRQQLEQAQAALKHLGIEFCSHCGKPHRAGATQSIGLRRITADGTVRETLCMDDPNAGCLLARTTLREPPAALDPGLTRAVMKLDPSFLDIEDSLAMWALSNRAYGAAHPLHGFIKAVAAGESLLNEDRFAERLVYHWPARFGGVRAGESPRALLWACGWRISDDEYAGLIDRCAVYAAAKRHPEQLRIFNAIQREGAGLQGRRPQ